MEAIFKNTSIVKAIAHRLGFDFCGISKAQKLEQEEKHLESWLNKGYHGKMKWMENHFDMRVDPTKLVPGAKSVISLLLNYFPEETPKDDQIKVSKYAFGHDYHHIIKQKLHEFLSQIQEEVGKVEGRVFVDSAPVLDRAWAASSGLGWIGKNSMLITKQKGSFYFIAEMILDLSLNADSPTTDHCGSCTKCIDACPTNAIVADKIIDSNKCISYLTIELKDSIPMHFKNEMEGWIFGCDICQDVCPWNRFAGPHKTNEFSANQRLMGMSSNDWKEMTEEVFRDISKKSAIKRAGFLKLRSTIDYVVPNI